MSKHDLTPDLGLPPQTLARSITAEPEEQDAPLATRTERIPRPRSVADLLADPDALAKLDDAKIARLWQIQKDIEAHGAKREYTAAMLRVQDRVSELKLKKTGFNAHTRAYYTKLEDVEPHVQPIMHEEGFSYSSFTRSSAKADHVVVCLEISHVAGHTECRELDAPIDDRGAQGAPNKTKIQGCGSTLTYVGRILLCAVLRIQTHADIDGNAQEAKPESDKPISEKQRKRLVDAAAAVKADLDKLYTHFGIAEMKDLTESQFKEAMVIVADKVAFMAQKAAAE